MTLLQFPICSIDYLFDSRLFTTAFTLLQLTAIVVYLLQCSRGVCCHVKCVHACIFRDKNDGNWTRILCQPI